MFKWPSGFADNAQQFVIPRFQADMDTIESGLPDSLQFRQLPVGQCLGTGVGGHPGKRS